VGRSAADRRGQQGAVRVCLRGRIQGSRFASW
jgi:hypothetical protein